MEYAVVAQAFMVVGDTPEADQHWRRAVASSPTPYYTLINKRAYADFLFRQGMHEQGRKLFAEALSILPNDSDFNKGSNGYTYQMWFVSEVCNIPSPHGKAEECHRQAQGLYESISAADYRRNCLNGLEAARAKLLPPLPVPTATPPASMGGRVPLP